MSAEIPESLATARTLRMPVFAEDATPRHRIDQLESYMLLTAFTQGELANDRLELLAKLAPLERRWAKLAPTIVKSKTVAAVEDAKCELDPELADAIAGLQWTIDRLQEEFDRLASDGDRCSRVLTPKRLDAVVPADFR